MSLLELSGSFRSYVSSMQRMINLSHNYFWLLSAIPARTQIFLKPYNQWQPGNQMYFIYPPTPTPHPKPPQPPNPPNPTTDHPTQQHNKRQPGRPREPMKPKGRKHPEQPRQPRDQRQPIGPKGSHHLKKLLDIS